MDVFCLISVPLIISFVLSLSTDGTNKSASKISFIGTRDLQIFFFSENSFEVVSANLFLDFFNFSFLGDVALLISDGSWFSICSFFTSSEI